MRRAVYREHMGIMFQHFAASLLLGGARRYVNLYERMRTRVCKRMTDRTVHNIGYRQGGEEREAKREGGRERASERESITRWKVFGIDHPRQKSSRTQCCEHVLGAILIDCFLLNIVQFFYCCFLVIPVSGKQRCNTWFRCPFRPYSLKVWAL